MVPDVAHRLSLTDGVLGVALACTILGAIPAMRLAGPAGNRPGVPLLAPGVLFYAATCLLPALAPNAAWLAAALACVGAASGSLDVLMNACVSTMEATDGRRRMHLAHAMYSAGLFGASVVTGLLRQAGLGYRPILVLVAGAIAALACLARRPATPVSATVVPPEQRSRLGWDAGLVALGLLCALAFVLENGMELWSALYMNRFLHAAPAIAALGPGVLGLSAVFGRLGGQALAARLGDARLIGVAGVVAACGVTGFTLAPSWPLALPALMLSGGGISIAAPIFFGLAGRWTGPATRGSAVSLVSGVSYLGFLVGPFYLGTMSDAFGLRAALLTLAACALSFSVLAPPLIGRRSVAQR